MKKSDLIRIGAHCTEPIEYVEWYDSTGPDGWHKPEDNPEVATICSIGWVVKETEKTICLTAHQAVAPDLNYHSTMCIPKVCVKKMILLKS